jgi:hypothetical protein
MLSRLSRSFLGRACRCYTEPPYTLERPSAAQIQQVRFVSPAHARLQQHLPIATLRILEARRAPFPPSGLWQDGGPASSQGCYLCAAVLRLGQSLARRVRQPSASLAPPLGKVARGFFV